MLCLLHAVRREYIDRHRYRAAFVGLQSPDPDDTTRNFFAPIIADGDDDRVLPRAAGGLRMPERALYAQS